MRQLPKPNEIYQHFKGKTYQIINIALHSETQEKMVVYQQMYAPYGVYVRPLEMFLSEVDHDKYPQVTQKYRFEKIQEPAWNLEMQVTHDIKKEDNTKEESVKEYKEKEECDTPKITEEAVSEEEQEEFSLDPGLLKFLEAESYEEKLDVLNQLRDQVSEHVLDTMAISIDCELKDGDVQQKYLELRNCLLTMEHFECNRLR